MGITKEIIPSLEILESDSNAHTSNDIMNLQDLGSFLLRSTMSNKRR